ncbi:MAG: hypothetical protein AseanaTS_03490 [Candidatus Pelagadaptatus aseana]|uniref:hypothetical protein n=1 Tax=Candidatus Pelagadaptatus aseana TaxID=3120508 RepID=UPI0039B2525B
MNHLFRTTGLAAVTLIGITVMVAACAVGDGKAGRPQACSPLWYDLVEARVATGDGHGHGPDPGSLEWRSVIEFKLGIRGNPSLPDLASSQWCDYIDSLVFQQ